MVSSSKYSLSLLNSFKYYDKTLSIKQTILLFKLAMLNYNDIIIVNIKKWNSYHYLEICLKKGYIFNFKEYAREKEFIC
jgi:hypothetical protein